MSARSYIAQRVPSFSDLPVILEDAFAVPSSLPGRIHTLLRLYSVERQVFYFRAILRRVWNRMHVRLLALPTEVLQEVFIILVDADPVELHPRGARAACGWLVGIWTCFDLRVKLLRCELLWGRSYTQIPSALGVFRALAGNAFLYCRVDADIPRRCAAAADAASKDSDDIDTMLQRIDLDSVSVIDIDKRVDALPLLMRMALRTSVPRLKVLRIHVEWPHLALQEFLLDDGIDRAIACDVLEEVCLRECWALCCSASLQRASFTFLESGLRPTINNVLCFLHYNRHTLRELTLCRALELVEPTLDHGVIDLPALEQFDIIDSAAKIAALMSSIHIPRARISVGAGVAGHIDWGMEQVSDLARVMSLTSYDALHVTVHSSGCGAPCCALAQFGSVGKPGGFRDWCADDPDLLVTLFARGTNDMWSRLLNRFLGSVPTGHFQVLRLTYDPMPCVVCSMQQLGPPNIFIPDDSVGSLFRVPALSRAPCYLTFGTVSSWVHRSVKVVPNE